MIGKSLKPGVYRIGDDVDGITLDNTHHPIVFCHWYGETDEKMVEDLWAMRNDTCYDGVAKKIILVHLFEVKPPRPTVRKRGADLALNDPYIQDGTFVSVMVVASSLLRGALTAVLWITGKDKFPMEFASSMEEGILIANDLLKAAKVEPPRVGPSYTFGEANILQWSLSDVGC